MKGEVMKKEFVEWLTRENLPMFNIRWCTLAERWNGSGFQDQTLQVWLIKPRKVARFVGEIATAEGFNTMLAAIQGQFPELRTGIGNVALRRALSDLNWSGCWWNSAGPYTEELRYLLRLGIQEGACCSGSVRVSPDRPPSKIPENKEVAGQACG